MNEHVTDFVTKLFIKGTYYILEGYFYSVLIIKEESFFFWSLLHYYVPQLNRWILCYLIFK